MIQEKDKQYISESQNMVHLFFLDETGLLTTREKWNWNTKEKEYEF